MTPEHEAQIESLVRKKIFAQGFDALSKARALFDNNHLDARDVAPQFADWLDMQAALTRVEFPTASDQFAATAELIRRLASLNDTPPRSAGEGGEQTRPSSAGGVLPIDYDKAYDRYYIPLPGGWEVQTKWRGSTFRICDRHGEGLPIPDSPYLHETLERMAREIHAACRVSPWRPIETAPKDGRTVIVGRHMGEFGFVRGTAYFQGTPGAFVSGWIARGFTDPPGELGLAHPTHWMPLPSPPAVESEDAQLAPQNAEDAR